MSLEDNFDLGTQTQNLLDYNALLIQGFQDFINKDSGRLIESYSNALQIIEANPTSHTEDIIDLQCNLGIAFFFNNRIPEGIQQMEFALSRLNQINSK